jgi:hypothetical protein
MNRADSLRASLLRARAGIDEALASLDTKEQSNDSGFYSSLRLPPDIRTRERFAEVCNDIPGATLTGKCWRVTTAAWWAHRRARVVPAAKIKIPAHLDDAMVEQALASIGRRRPS